MEFLIQNILNGNPDGFRQIIQKYEKQLLKIAYHFIHDWDGAQDITQNTFISLYKNLSKFDSSKAFEPWLYQIHFNQCRSDYRKRKIRNQMMKLFVAEKPSLDSYQVDSDIIRKCIDECTWK
jgi:RNA polymerase sigma-70 factor (ECF subfamily)